MESKADAKATSSASQIEVISGKDVPSDDHIVRYVGPSMIRENGTVIGNGFCLRKERKEETGVSVNWLEAFDGDKLFQIANVRRAIKKNLTVNKNGRLAELNVGEVRQKVHEELVQ